MKRVAEIGYRCEVAGNPPASHPVFEATCADCGDAVYVIQHATIHEEACESRAQIHLMNHPGHTVMVSRIMELTWEAYDE